MGKWDLTLVLIKDELWRLIFTPLLAVDWSVISVMCGVWKDVAIKPDMNWIGLDLGLEFETVEQSHLQGVEQFVIELSLEGV